MMIYSIDDDEDVDGNDDVGKYDGKDNDTYAIMKMVL